MSTGQYSMTSLCACQTRTPAEDLLSSQDTRHLTRRKSQMWIVGTWNVQAMVDI